MKNIIGNKRAVSSVLGISILLVISLLAIGIITLYTLPLITEAQDTAKAQKVEQAFTVLDSRTSKASLGESPLQTTSFSLMGENVAVYGYEEAYKESRIMIIFLSSDYEHYDSFYEERGTWGAWEKYQVNDNFTDENFTGLSEQMGKVRYNSGDRIVAYEGGGVWSRYPTGGTIMISPPELHYNGETLTLPIMKVAGHDSTSGNTNVNINVRSANSNIPTILYPNKDEGFTNPLDSDKILIYINSEFYDGWAKYAETLTSTNTMLDHNNKTAIIEMDTMPEMGTSQLSHSFQIARLNISNPEPIYNFSFIYEAERKSAGNFNPATSSLTATSGTKTLVYTIDRKDQDYIKLDSIKYTDSSIGKSEEWISDTDSGFVIEKEHNPPVKIANTTICLVSNSYILNYNSNHDSFSWGPVSQTTMTPDLHITKSNENSTQTLNNVTQHYIKLLSMDGAIECTWQQGNNQKIDVENSQYTLVYDGGGAILTYLHVTSNELEVTLD